MPRQGRKQSEGSVYHITQRGIGQQIIFEDEADHLHFLKLIKRYLEQSEGALELYAWCLMSNHIHLLVHGSLDDVSLFMKQLGVAYARYFNNRHNRTGHLFQDRFKSEPIDSDEYLLAATRYIHANPLKVGNAGYEHCRWTSYREYLGLDDWGLTTTRFLIEMLDGLQSFIAFHHTEAQPIRFLDVDRDDDKRAYSDEQALQLAKEILSEETLYSLKSLKKNDRNRKIAQLRDAGLSIRQISRITGIGKGIIQRVFDYERKM